MSRAAEKLSALAVVGLRRPRFAALAALVLVAASLVLALGLRPSAAPALLADPHAGAGKATPAQEQAFGAEPIAIRVDGDLFSNTLTGDSLTRLASLERRIGRLRGVRQVFGPGTFVEQTVVQLVGTFRKQLGPIADQAEKDAQAARRRALADGQSAARADQVAQLQRARTLGPKLREYQDLIVRLGSVGVPAVSNRNFVLNLVFGADQQPKARFRWLFPDARHAVIVVRPEPGLSDARLRALGDQLQTLSDKGAPSGLKLHVAGAPLVVAGIADEFPAELLRLAPFLIAAMVLALLFGLRRGRGRLRLLLLAGGAVLVTAAASRVLGLGLTPATVAALPVVLGLAVDYGVQLQARYWHERTDGHDAGPAAGRAVAAVGPTLLAAAGAMTVGFVALTLSSVPLIDRLGWTLAAGTVASVAVVLAFGAPLLAFRDRQAGEAPRLNTASLRRQGARGRRVLLAGAALAVLGLALSGGTRVQSDLAQLAPRDLPELKAAQSAQQALGTAGTLRLAVTGPNVTRRPVVLWEAALQRRILALDGRIKPGPDLGDLLAQNGAAPTSQTEIDQILALVPSFFRSAVLTPDRTREEMSFGVPLVDVHQQADLLDRIRDTAGDPPEGVSLEPAGLLALGAASVRDLESGRLKLLILAALAIFAVLYAIHRRVDRAALPLVPALLAAGLSALVVRIAGIELSPLGAGLEPLVLAVGVEFGVLLEARYREARGAGEAPPRARRTAVGSVGGAVAVSSVTVGLGFAMLVASRFELLQQFGVLVALEVALCGALAVWLVPLLACEVDERAARRAAAGIAPWHPRDLPGQLRRGPGAFARGVRSVPARTRAGVRAAPGALSALVDAAGRVPPALLDAVRAVPGVLGEIWAHRPRPRMRRLQR